MSTTDGTKVPRNSTALHWSRVGVMPSILANLRLVVTLTVLGGLAGLVVSAVQPERYVAEARLFLSSSSPFDGIGGSDYINDPDRYLMNQAELLGSEPVLAAAAERPGVGTDADRKSVV